MVPYCIDLVPYGTIRYLMAPYSTLWYHMVPYGTLWYHMVPYDPPPGLGETLLGSQKLFGCLTSEKNVILLYQKCQKIVIKYK